MSKHNVSLLVSMLGNDTCALTSVYCETVHHFLQLSTELFNNYLSRLLLWNLHSVLLLAIL